MRLLCSADHTSTCVQAELGEPDGPFEALGADRATAGQARARSAGHLFDEIAIDYLSAAGAHLVAGGLRVDEVHVDAIVRGTVNGVSFWVNAHGVLDREGNQPGLQRTDTVLKAIGTAYILGQKIDRLPIILITSHLPAHGSAAARQLAAVGSLFFDVVATTGDLRGLQRLHTHFGDRPPVKPAAGVWIASAPRRRAHAHVQMSFATDSGDVDA